jgi:phosphate transport system substrate-binding protein
LLTKKRRLIGMLACVVAIATLAAACGNDNNKSSSGSSTTAKAGSTLSGNLNAAGSSFIQPAMLQWIGDFTKENPDVKINYNANGSGAGIQALIDQQVDFAASDAFMKDDEIATAESKRSGAKIVHIPMVHGAVVLAYNVSGLDNLVLDGPTTADIFMGKITKWNDPAIKALNPNTNLPDTDIIPAHREDKSGTTSIFTTWLSSESDAWKNDPNLGAGKEMKKWPGGVAGAQNAGVAQAIQQNPGAIGYVELAYALQNKISFAEVKNDSGEAVKATPETTATAAESADIPADLRFNIVNVKNGYPIVGTTWVIAYTTGNKNADVIKAFLTWALENGDDAALKLDYAPIPDSLQTKALEMINKIGS